MNKFKFSIIVVTYNNRVHVKQLLDSITTHIDTKETPVVIVDNNSSDDTVDLLLAKTIQGISVYSLDKNFGFGVGNNIGISKVDSEYYLLLNSDAYFIADTIAELNNLTCNLKNVGVAGIPLIFPDGSPQTYTYPFTTPLKQLLHIFKVKAVVDLVFKVKIFNLILLRAPLGKRYIQSKSRGMFNFEKITLTSNPSIIKTDWVCGASMLITSNFIKKSGGFDPNIFLYGEDEDLCITAHRLGYDVVSLGINPIVHEFGWGKNRENSAYSKVKYSSLKYFIDKNFKGVKRIVMRLLLWMDMRLLN